MFRQILQAALLTSILAGVAAGQAGNAEASDEPNSIVITFKDGHQQTFPASEISKIEFKGLDDSGRSSASYIGRWKVGTGAGAASFYITLQPDGKAFKSIGSAHGKWSMYGNEARISWDDGWHDVIRKAGNHYEKAAYRPGRSYSDQPDNITGATNTEPL